MSGMAGAQQCIIEAQVEAKKESILKYAPYARNHPESLIDKVFCLCTACSVTPLMIRNDLCHRMIAWRHSQADVGRGLITKAILRGAVGTKTFISYGDYFHLFRHYAKGQVDVHGIVCGVQLEPPADTLEAAARSMSPANPSQGSPQAAGPMEDEGPYARESHFMEDAEQSSRANANAPEQSGPQGYEKASSNCPMDQSTCSSRKSCHYTKEGLCGCWASYWSTADCTRPSKEELKGRQPGRDGSRSVRCVLDSDTGEVFCSENAEAAGVVNKFLAEEVARACRNNKTHNCFTSDLQAFKNCEHVTAAIKQGLVGLETYAQVMRRLEKASGLMTYVYDICPDEGCAAVFRGEHRDHIECPRCKESRFDKTTGRAAKQLYYLPISEWLGAAWADPDIARGVSWSTERSDIGATDGTMFRDHFDASMWQETFCNDPVISENGGPARNVGLQFCADGVMPYKRKSHSMWFGALSILNLPPATRHTVDTMHLCFIVPGPKKPSDFSPFVDILTDELDQLYWEGVEVKERSGMAFMCRAMLLSIVTDYRGIPELFRLAQSPAFVGACYKCQQVGCRMAEGSTKTMYPGSWRWLPANQKALRAQACRLNGTQPANSLPPKYKTAADMRAAAEEGDDNLAQGLSGDKHSVKQTGVYASHPFWKLKYFTEEMYGPDPMHTLSNEVKACWSMLSGSVYCGTTKAARVIRDYEAGKNNRYIPSKAVGKGSKKLKATGNKQTYSFVLPTEAQKLVSQILEDMTSEGHIPKGWSTKNLHHCFEHPSFLKAHDWLLLAGPVGKYALQGYLPANLEAVLFGYFDCLAKLGAKEMSHSAAAKLQQEVVVSLARMELEFPAWELDINRHMILHLAERIPTHGPPWASAMWSYERLWNRLCQWKSQDNEPEAVMVNTYKAFKAACKVKGSSNIRTFDRPTDEVLIPAYIHAHLTGGEVHVDLSDGHPAMRLEQKKAKKDHAKAEFHMFHLRTHGRYKGLWVDYITHGVGKDHRKLQLKDMESLLGGWQAWGLTVDLAPEDMELCRGPHHQYLPYDRACINGQHFVVSRLQRTKYRNDIVMMETAGKGIEVGQVKNFLKLPVAGTALAARLESDTILQQVAWVEWFGRSASGAASSSCGVVCAKKVQSDNSNGNVFSITDLKPFNVAVASRVLQDGSLSTQDWQVLVSRPIVLL